MSKAKQGVKLTINRVTSDTEIKPQRGELVGCNINKNFLDKKKIENFIDDALFRLRESNGNRLRIECVNESQEWCNEKMAEAESYLAQCLTEVPVYLLASKESNSIGMTSGLNYGDDCSSLRTYHIPQILSHEERIGRLENKDEIAITLPDILQSSGLAPEEARNILANIRSFANSGLGVRHLINGCEPNVNSYFFSGLGQVSNPYERAMEVIQRLMEAKEGGFYSGCHYRFYNQKDDRNNTTLSVLSFMLENLCKTGNGVIFSFSVKTSQPDDGTGVLECKFVK